MIEFSEKALDFLSTWDTFLVILEGPSGSGKTVDATFKFGAKILDSEESERRYANINVAVRANCLRCVKFKITRLFFGFLYLESSRAYKSLQRKKSPRAIK
mgnify:CR=1 FL=1